jgi:hypothetical protein
MDIVQNASSWQGKFFPANRLAGKQQGKCPATLIPARKILDDLVLIMAKRCVLTL